MSYKDIDFPPARQRRSEALKWWAALSSEDRVVYVSHHHGDERHPNTLTGREIENIYQTEELS